MKLDMKLDWYGWMLGRLLVALLFIPAGFIKFLEPDRYLARLEEVGLSVSLLPLVGGFEIAVGSALLLGFRLRHTGIAIGLFCILTAVLFHMDWAESAERAMFAKNLAIAGGVFMLAFSQAPQRYLHD